MGADQFNLVKQLPQTPAYSVLQNGSRRLYAQMRDQGLAKWNAASGRFLIPLSRRVAALCVLAIVFAASGPQAAKGPVFLPGPNDSLQLLPGRSITMTVTLGIASRGR